MRCIVTGGAGFIGSHLAEALHRRGDDVAVVDNFSTGHRVNLAWGAGRARVIEGDIRDPEAMRAVFAGADVVFHQAALPSVARSIADPGMSHDHNANGTLAVLVAARAAGVRRVVYAGSSSAYGENPTLPRAESLTPMPLSPYAVAKLAGEHYCRAFHRAYALETVVLRYFNVFGPRQDPGSPYAAVIPLFLRSLLRGEPVRIHGDGEQSRDFTFVANAVQANLLACDAPAAAVAGEVINVGCGERITLNQLLDTMQDLLGKRVQPIHGPPRPGDARDSQADITKARKLLGYEPSVRLREGLELTAAWLQSEGRA